MAYKPTYHEDSDADDEYERSVFTSPTLPADFESSPTDSGPPSTEHTPTTFTHSGESHGSPTGVITQWTAGQCADFITSLGLGQYADNFIEEGVTGEELIVLQHADLKEMGVSSVGHRLTILGRVYEAKVKHNVRIEPDHYVPLSADAAAQELAPTQDDIARIIRIIEDRDKRIHSAEAELRILKEDLTRVAEENRKLREDHLTVARMVKDRSQPLPTPDRGDEEQTKERSGTGLSRKFSTKNFFLSGSGPKQPSPTIHEGRTLTDSSSLDPSAAALAASSHLTASISGGVPPATTPHTHTHAQPSPTSPAYNTTSASAQSRSFPRDGPASRSHTADDYNSYTSSYSNASTLIGDRETRDLRTATPAPLSSRPLRSANTSTTAGNSGPTSAPTDAAPDPPNSGGLGPPAPYSSAASIAPSTATNPQVEIFKSFRVSIDDPCHKVLPVALKKYNITADWRQYALYIVHGDQERCLGLNERPLILFKQLDKEGRKPMFMLRKHASPMDVGHVSTIAGGGGGGGVVNLPGGVL
ncbi:hypothetical protein W97_09307 [Coniosporium apollinis CBS 100218]|uniref:RA-domain-containing protein n=1 Tax=Coniosporium apollinis (strain CBS 100218) TaxID=1168221 RepID=R7Z7N5_CONA1|nr:uncharacterized protein W97_09307 [Coniosporium apollinis CBS 100218]EON70039.1 hypothetical protein W97_09307 [Coniosporium apollinis CBS 100218]